MPDHHDATEPYDADDPWRVGRSVPRHLYLGDKKVGDLDTGALARAVVAAMNGEGLDPTLPRLGRFRAIGRTLYMDGADVGRVDTMHLADLIVEAMNDAYGHTVIQTRRPHPGASDPQHHDAVGLVAASLIEIARSIAGGQLAPGQLVTRADAIAMNLVTLARRADAHAADVHLDAAGPAVEAAAQALRARWIAWPAEPFAEYGGADLVATTALQAAAASMFAAGAGAHLNRLADEQATASDGDPRLAAILRAAATEATGGH